MIWNLADKNQCLVNNMNQMLRVTLEFKCHDKHNQRLNHFYAITFNILIFVEGVK